MRSDRDTQKLQLPIFGYTIAFTADEEISGAFGKAAEQGELRCCWDFSLPHLDDDSVWHGA